MASISKREVNGKPRYDVNWRDAAGNGRRRTFRTRTRADEFRAKVEVGGAGHDGEKVTVREWVEGRIEFRYADPAQLATRQQVEQRMRRHVYPVLGKARLVALVDDPDLVERWVVGLRSKGLAVSTVKVIASNLRTMLEDAVTQGVIVRNPLSPSLVRQKLKEDYSDRPAWEADEDEGTVTFWEPSRVEAVRESIREDLRLMVDLGTGIGVRQGELLGLSPDDFDFDGGFVRVRCQVKVLNGNHLVFHDLKHRGKATRDRKERRVPLPPLLAASVREHIEAGRCGPVTLPWAHPGGRQVTRELLCVTREGKAWNRNYLNTLWHAALRRAGVEVKRSNGMHALRHYFASVLIDAGVPITNVAEYLGHASAEFTLRVYAHPLEAADDRARAALARAERYITGTSARTDNVFDLRRHVQRLPGPGVVSSWSAAGTGPKRRGESSPSRVSRRLGRFYASPAGSQLG
jgi:integrase